MHNSPQFDNTNVTNLAHYKAAKASVESDVSRGVLPNSKKLVRKETIARAARKQEALKIADQWVAAGAHLQPPLRKSVRDNRTRLRKVTDWLGYTVDNRYDHQGRGRR